MPANVRLVCMLPVITFCATFLERKFKDAKDLSDRIKALMAEGEATRNRIETLQSRVTKTLGTLNDMKEQDAACQINLERLERDHGRRRSTSFLASWHLRFFLPNIA